MVCKPLGVREIILRCSRDKFGLERIAEEFVGHDKWRNIVTPFLEYDSCKPTDWSPEEKCCFCSAKKQPPYDPASGIYHSEDGRWSMKSFLPDGMKGNSVCKTDCFNKHFWSDGSVGGSRSPSPHEEKPLDLSLHSSRICKNTIKEDEEDSSSASSVLRVPLPSSKLGQKRRTDLGYKRAYTDEELQAALRDIQTGKLGTRRAAVIYGIPRSTLRNKVYKLAMERKKKQRGTIDEPKTPSVINSQSKEEKLGDNVSTVGSESLRQLLKMTINHKVQKTQALPSKEWSTKNESFKMWPFISPDFYSSDPTSIVRLINGLEHSHAVAPLIAKMLTGIETLALKRPPSEDSVPDQSLIGIGQLPLLPELIHHLAEERMLLECDRSNRLCKEETDTSEKDMSDCLSNVILKVPSFRPGTQLNDSNSDTANALSLSQTGHYPGNKGISVSLKELIAKSISQRVGKTSFCPKKKNNYTHSQPAVNEGKTYNNLKTRLSSSPATHSSCPSSRQTSETSKRERKQIRPKRGRYRNYDRNSLAMAVRAVQRGEMSVHRAGNYYGVPHSTLEYKVKERHLLRNKKNLKYHQKSSESSASDKSNESNHSLKKLLQGTNISEGESTLCSDKPESSTSHPTSLPSHTSLWKTMPFLSEDLAGLSSSSSNFFASQMIRKLQANAQRQEGCSGNQRQEVGILENLIKKTLEKSVSMEEKGSSSLIISCSNGESDVNLNHK
ncbi:mushroom body large-type Kenyon cell-specific protein 1-like isoform X2 [Limulus polyphemus]|uniref:Mushroom body large-type Kenyon cell-specific protein 1-like isoform X2 n=1 Tax=Limulus polyphemus TaxID=6850 RepID=A0ABM1TNI6_LIMPO|nr:mushroom body large-type Kenyon cell-specific protein 1-like isoform X2 [Limulus polyphemus]